MSPAVLACLCGKSLTNDQSMARAARFSCWLDMTSMTNCFAALTQSNAMQRPEDAHLTFDDSQLAVVPEEVTASLGQ